MAYSYAYNVISAEIEKLAASVRQPDLEVICDLDVNEALTRLKRRGTQLFKEQENEYILKKARTKYLEIAAARSCFISTDLGESSSQEKLWDAILAVVAR